MKENSQMFVVDGFLIADDNKREADDCIQHFMAIISAQGESDAQKLISDKAKSEYPSVKVEVKISKIEHLSSKATVFITGYAFGYKYI